MGLGGEDATAARRNHSVFPWRSRIFSAAAARPHAGGNEERSPTLISRTDASHRPSSRADSLAPQCEILQVLLDIKKAGRPKGWRRHLGILTGIHVLRGRFCWASACLRRAMSVGESQGSFPTCTPPAVAATAGRGLDLGQAAAGLRRLANSPVAPRIAPVRVDVGKHPWLRRDELSGQHRPVPRWSRYPNIPRMNSRFGQSENIPRVSPRQFAGMDYFLSSMPTFLQANLSVTTLV